MMIMMNIGPLTLDVRQLTDIHYRHTIIWHIMFRLKQSYSLLPMHDHKMGNVHKIRNEKSWKNCIIEFFKLVVCLFFCFTSQVNSYGHCGTVSSPNHTFFLGKLEQAVNQ